MKKSEERSSLAKGYLINIDIEAVDTLETASMVSIGASVYDDSGVKIPDGEFCCDIDWVAAIKECERTASLDTLLWWHSDKVSDSSRSVLHSGGQVTLHDALVMLVKFIGRFSDDGYIAVFSKGPDYDMKILQSSFDFFDIKLPWDKQEQACVRTMILLGSMLDLEMDLYPSDDDSHNALNDADHQGGLVIQVLKELGLLRAKTLLDTQHKPSD